MRCEMVVFGLAQQMQRVLWREIQREKDRDKIGKPKFPRRWDFGNMGEIKIDRVVDLFGGWP